MDPSSQAAFYFPRMAVGCKDESVDLYLTKAKDSIYIIIESLQKQLNSSQHNIVELLHSNNRPTKVVSHQDLSEIILGYPNNTVIVLPRIEPLKSLIENGSNYESMDTKPSEFRNRYNGLIKNESVSTITGIPVRLTEGIETVAIIITRSAKTGTSPSLVGRLLDGGVVDGISQETKVIEWINFDNKLLLFKFRYCGNYKLLLYELNNHCIIKETHICCNVVSKNTNINYSEYFDANLNPKLSADFDHREISTQNKEYYYLPNKATNFEMDNIIFNSKTVPDIPVNSQEPIKQTENPKKHVKVKFNDNYSNSPQNTTASYTESSGFKCDLHLSDNEERPKKKVKTVHKEDTYSTTSTYCFSLPGTVNPKDVFGYERNLYENDS